MEMLNQKQKIILIAGIIIAIGIIIFQYVNSTKEVYSYVEKENIIEEKNEIMSVPEKEEKIIIHVTGAVKKNGIVEVREKARINDVIEAAGGVTKDADLTNVNLAYIVEDGQKIYIPSKSDKNTLEENKKIVSEEAGKNVTEEKNNSKKIVNINKAGLEELKTLPGIGESTALKILEYREKHGKFKSVEDLKKITGVGDSKLDTIKNIISI